MALYLPLVLIGVLLMLFILVFLVGAVVVTAEKLIWGGRWKNLWEAATKPDPADPEGLTPVVRMIDRDLGSALVKAGTSCVNRTIHSAATPTPAWIGCEIAGTGLTVSISQEMVTVGERRLEVLDYRTPEEFSAGAVDLALRAIGKGTPLRRWDRRWLVIALLTGAILLWVILTLPAPRFVPR